MTEKTKKKLITAALPYVNNAPHLGNIIGCVLSADVYARFCRNRGYETLYICGTDGYGTATETKAKAEGVTPREICERYHQVHTKIYEFFNISFDAFGKTFADTHTGVVQQMYHDLEKHQNLIEEETEQTYCEHDNMFLADRFVEGTCPHCHYEDARGDQCESCGKLLNPVELVKPRCSICANTPMLRKTKHLYLDLPKLSQQLETWQNAAMEAGGWTANAKSTTKSWLKQGLNPRPITRDLKWGVAVPKEGYEEKVFYVWFDAPIGYISITKHFFPDTWQNWWQDPEGTELYQFIGKDNIPFHSVIFPASLIGSGVNWTMLHHLNSTEYLNYENTKFSKSKGIGIFGTDAMELDFPVDLWRFYLLGSRPEKQDTNFNWDEFFDRVNNDLIDNICNLVNRVLVYHKKNFPGAMRSLEYDDASHIAFRDEVKALVQTVTDELEAGNLRDGLKQILAIGNLSNRFFQEQEPWKKIKEDQLYVEKTMNLLAHVIRNIGVMLEPYMPATSERILKMLGAEGSSWSAMDSFNNLEGKQLGEVEILFHKLENKLVDQLRDRFGGQGHSYDSLDIRVGKILSVEEHPHAPHLYVEKVDIGEGEPLTICSALKKHYQADELSGKKVLVLKNLPTADFKGVASQGMILVCQKNKKLELFTDDAWSVGERLLAEGQKAEELPQDISFDDFCQLELTVKEHKAYFKSMPLSLAGKALMTTRVVNGKIK